MTVGLVDYVTGLMNQALPDDPVLLREVLSQACDALTKLKIKSSDLAANLAQWKDYA